MSSIHAEPPPPIVNEPGGINYATGAALGKGGFAICHRAERYDGSRPTGHVFALKIVKTKMEPAKLAQKFVSELQIHSKLSHPNIVTFHRAFSFQTSTYVVLELCPNGSLADMLKKRKYLTLPEIRRFVIQICGAVKYLHHRHIVHRDLKTGNLFLDDKMNVKVGDFGLAALLVTEKEMEARRRTTMCGTPNYLAPEILEKGKGHSEKVDLWAIGVIAYTLAVGKAPFHASTKEEIYKKLKCGAFTWPDLSVTTNQSSDLRQLVSSLLVPEEHRPVPDQIVSHPFFKIAFVPSGIPSAAKERCPKWPEVAIPSTEAVRRGYSDTWYSICKQSGVGEFENGKCFKLNGGTKVRSIVHDLAQEAMQGRQPTMPIPKHIVYTSTVSEFDARASADIEPVEEEARPPSRQLKEISHNEVTMPKTVPVMDQAARDTELMPPPPIVRKTSGVRRAARTISEEAAKSSAGVKIIADDFTPVAYTSKAQETASTATARLRELNTSSLSSYRTARSEQAGDSLKLEQPAKEGTVKRSADASLARRPRATKPKERPPSPEFPGPLATLDELKRALPVSRLTRKKTEPEVIEILSDPEPDEAPGGAIISLPPPPQMPKTLPVPRRPSRDVNVVAGTDPNAVLDRLSEFRDNLRAALSNTYRARTSPPDAEDLPFITRWVDYSRKHGVGYVLADGTVGCVLNGRPKTKTPLTHCFVRNGQQWLDRMGPNYSGMDAVPLEFLEDHGGEGITRKVFKGLGSVKEGPLKHEADRRFTYGTLWARFARYMCKTLDGEEMQTTNRSGENFVRFYQRIGNVGIWHFADGCFQIHWPDHTKMVLSATGTHISATCISPEAAAYLASHSDLLPHHVSSREIFADSITSLLHEGGRVRARIVKANAMSEKLTFILDVVEQWISNGGLGRLDGESDCRADEEGKRLLWDGLMAKGSRKTDRVTVGRCGGDEAGRFVVGA